MARERGERGTIVGGSLSGHAIQFPKAFILIVVATPIIFTMERWRRIISPVGMHPGFFLILIIPRPRWLAGMMGKGSLPSTP